MVLFQKALANFQILLVNLGNNLNLGNNHLEGVIAEVHFASLTKLKELILGSNNLILNVSGDWIPPFKLNFIDMGSCKLGPKFPAWLQTQANISFLNLSSSGIVDTLPNWFWDVFPTYETHISLDISNNGIKGSMLPISKLHFDWFDLSSNFFCGPFPPSLNISYLVDISNNSFSGSVQPVIDNQGLSRIFLSGNNFSGEIPSSICLLEVDVIDLSWNLLTGELPNCWNKQNASYVHFIDFSRNKLFGSIPHTFGSLTSLISLLLSYNNISGNIPTTLINCTSLQILDLGMNELTGIIPTWVGERLTYLKILALRSNNFTGNVPSNLSKLKELQILDLGNNTLSGRIPRSFGNFTAMMNIQSYYIDYFSNSSFFSRRGYVDYLQLYTKGGKWTYGKLLNQVTIVDLSFNNLSGQIPKEFGNLQGLIFLNLFRNHLVGSIPDEIGLMDSLESLDLSKNGLSNNIPLSLAKLTALEFLNLSYNNLSRNIPSGNQLQTFTIESYIGNPKLCGFPLTKSCDSNNKTINDEITGDEATVLDYWYVSIASGFVFGSCIVWGTFLLKKEWKDAYFQYVDSMYEAVYVAIAVKIRIARKGDETTSG